VLSGGDDDDPRLYGAVARAHSTHIDPERDAFELALMEAALEHDVPLLGICRGCQLLNVARGGTLVEHLPLAEGEAHGQLAYPLWARVHHLELTPGELLEGILAPDVRVNSFHHQAVDRLGDGVVALAAAPDGVCEAIRVGEQALGVQWHPEYLREHPDPVFLWLVRQARRTTTTTKEQAHAATA
jgi:putative glutamine amidotransferase